MQGSNGETVAATSDGPLEDQVGSLTLADDQSADISEVDDANAAAGDDDGDDDDDDCDASSASDCASSQSSESSLWRSAKREDCDICIVALPVNQGLSSYMPCCGKTLCGGCIHEHNRQISIINSKKAEKELPPITHSCPFCRTPAPKTLVEGGKRFENRVRLGDVTAMMKLGGFYRSGPDGQLCLERDESKALELYREAAKRGCPDAFGILGAFYMGGFPGIEQDPFIAKGYLEKAVRMGALGARHNLGTLEYTVGFKEVAVRHWKISAADGMKTSVQKLCECFREGLISKAELEESMRARFKVLNESRTDERDRFLQYRQSQGWVDDC